MAFVIKFVQQLKTKVDCDTVSNNVLPVKLLNEAEAKIVQMIQETSFGKEIDILKSNGSNTIPKSSSIHKLDVFLDIMGILRVGERLRNSFLNCNLKYPILLPRKHEVTNIIVNLCHQKVAHGRRGFTLNYLRNSGFRVINGNSVCRSIIFKCVMCRRLRGKLGVQRIADFQEERTQDAPPFTYCGLDMFGSFTIKFRKTELKRYGIIFTGLASRAVHLEVANTMNTDSFIQALRRFIGKRGNMRMLR